MMDVKVWDPLVRIGHWILVAAFALAFVTEGDPRWLHVWSGYVIAAYLSVRVFWGLAGTHHARFTSFLTGPLTGLAYLRDLVLGRSRRYLGHSPAGGLMVMALLVVLTGTAATGMAYYARTEGQGPLSGLVMLAPATASDPATALRERKRASRDLKEIHETLANLTLLLIALHVAGVALASFRHRENLPRAMITGRKRTEP